MHDRFKQLEKYVKDRDWDFTDRGTVFISCTPLDPLIYLKDINEVSEIIQVEHLTYKDLMTESGFIELKFNEDIKNRIIKRCKNE